MRMPAMTYKKLQLQRQSSDETESSCCSRSSKAHRRTPSFIEAIQFDSNEEEDMWRHDPTKDVPFRSSSHVHKEDKCSPASNIDLKQRLGAGDDETLRALELIRELSFDFGSGSKRRALISSTDSTASSSECDTSSHTDPRRNNADHIDTSPIGLDLKPEHIHPCVSYSRMDSSSSLLGLKYLPDDW